MAFSATAIGACAASSKGWQAGVILADPPAGVQRGLGSAGLRLAGQLAAI